MRPAALLLLDAMAKGCMTLRPIYCYGMGSFRPAQAKRHRRRSLSCEGEGRLGAKFQARGTAAVCCLLLGLKIQRERAELKRENSTTGQYLLCLQVQVQAGIEMHWPN